MRIITIGRSQDNNIVIDDHRVSRIHLQLVQHNNEIYSVVDLNSANGTYVNGQRISGEYYLQANDIVRIGNSILPWQSYFYTQDDRSIRNEFMAQPPKGNSKKIIWFVVAVAFLLLLCGGIAWKILHDKKQNKIEIENVEIVESPAIVEYPQKETQQVSEIVAEKKVETQVKQETGSTVYIVTAGYWDGDESDPQYKKIFTPRLWKNGEVRNLTNKNGGVAHSVFVSGNDVYVAGNQNGYATLWKNGIVQQLSKEEGGIALSVCVFGNDVYVAGEENSVAILWKNGIAQKLTDENNWGCANSVFVSENDVYVAGIEDGNATLWKNGLKQMLAEGNSANAVFVSGNDVYVAGEGNSVAILWKNGIPQYLNKEKKYGARANSVFVSENNVYVAGTDEERGSAMLWKNGVAQKLTKQRNTDAFSVVVFGNDVYVVGWENGFATLWKNGVAQKLIDVRSVFATSVFVK